MTDIVKYAQLLGGHYHVWNLWTCWIKANTGRKYDPYRSLRIGVSRIRFVGNRDANNGRDLYQKSSWKSIRRGEG